MTNRLPVVGKRYKLLEKGSFAWAEFKKFSLINNGEVIFCYLKQFCEDGASNGYYSCQLKDFWDRFEEWQPQYAPIGTIYKCEKTGKLYKKVAENNVWETEL